jgi:hypothetical protein
MERFAHVAQVRFTSGQWRMLCDMALLRGVTIEDLIRELLGIVASDAGSLPQERHLQLVTGKR